MYDPSQHDDAEADPYAFSQQFEQTQQASQSQQPDVFEGWDETLWGLLIPMSRSLPRIHLRKDRNSLTLGRGSENIIVLPHLKISNKHCMLRWDSSLKGDSSLTVMDKSSNGTFINGSKVGKGRSAILKDGSDIAFGSWSDSNKEDNYRFVFRYMADGPPASGLDRDYDVGFELGRGSFATVKRAICRADGKPYAIKMISRTKLRADGESATTVFLKEIEILQRLHHPNICQLKEHFHDTSNVILVLEYVDGGDLLDYIINRNGVSEVEARHFAYQLCRALKYIHSKDIAHRDLKPENILLTKDNPPILKIADFGLAKVVDSMTRFKTMCGTPIYLAPEVILRNQDDTYSHVVDSWSAGVITFAMYVPSPKTFLYTTDQNLITQQHDRLANSNPFLEDDASVISIRFRSRYIDWSLLDDKNISVDCRKFIERLLEENPTDRMTCAEALRHPWLAPLAASDPKVLSDTPNDSMMSVQANAGSFLDEPVTTPQPPRHLPLHAEGQPAQGEQKNTGVSGEFEEMKMDDASSFNTETTVKPTPEAGRELGGEASSKAKSQRRGLERKPMQFAEVDENGQLSSFRVFPKSPPKEGPDYVDTSAEDENNHKNLKRKERSDTSMADETGAGAANGAHKEQQNGNGNEAGASSDVVLTPVSENGESTDGGDGRLENATARKRVAVGPAVIREQSDADMSEGGPTKRSRAMPADVAA
ncbi:Pkinase-domain-containing protein [Fomitiporia mediterranea MF3/22]|uniref:Pkinase-domain-containing protein n=1 Tax=Fomitiporia mediterranea (strain MF3/22) TaxID=694068 RepID=UPI0004407C39|nr:Pkinase-domain-containing protein [Fomitiporia mediterranea MF3/22]EJD02564.1 Pkinase-domain-containing protein [Fomitiporia mediterranea MF3/22]